MVDKLQRCVCVVMCVCGCVLRTAYVCADNFQPQYAIHRISNNKTEVAKLLERT